MPSIDLSENRRFPEADADVVREIVADIQSLGVRAPSDIQGRRGGAGPAEGRALLIQSHPVNVPVSAAYVARSPCHLAPTESGVSLFRRETPLFPVRIVPEPLFYGAAGPDKIPFRKIALLHGSDCLATTVLQDCVNWNTDRRCRFCGTGVSLKNGSAVSKKTPEQLARVAREAALLDGVSHMVLTSGTGRPPGSEIPYLAECVRAVKAASGLPVHVQFAPPPDPADMAELKAAGTDTVGIHIECFDPDTLACVAPAKAALGLDRYETAWKRAVALFGPNQVSSFLIAGLGEPPESIVQGSEVLADLGVYPFVVPLRPVPGSEMEHAVPPDPELMKDLYRAVARILSLKGLSSKRSRAGCVRCGACSALSLYETPADRLICHTARTQAELAAAMAIRRRVFVEEQHLFQDSDADDHDPSAIHLVLKSGPDIVGTVRAFRGESGNGHWIGGRLAVRKESRSFRSARLLVKEAMKRVKKRGCTRFTAQVQEKNVPFFSKIGWRAVGPRNPHLGLPHQLMEADLDTAPDECAGLAQRHFTEEDR